MPKRAINKVNNLNLMEETKAMKTYQYIHATPFGSVIPISRWRLSDRGASLALLSIPFVFAVLAFLMAVIATMMGEMEQGSFFFYMAALSYSYLVVCLMYMPAYAIGYLWYAWKTKGVDTDLSKPLLWIPLIAAAFVWLPIVFFPQLTGVERIQASLLLTGVSLIVGYPWVAVVRFILHIWRKV
jgi:hypothetical protein